MKRLLSVLLILMLVFAFAACNNTNDPNSDNTAGDTPGDNVSEYKDTLVFGNNNDISGLYPHVNSDNHSNQVMMMVYDTLFLMDDDAVPQPNLVEEYSVSDDELIWTFKLKEGITFHDGKPLTAQVIYDIFNQFLPPATGNRICGFINVWSEIKVIDELTFTIATAEPYGPMLSLLCHASLSIFDPAMYDDGDNIGKNVATINGTGAYKLESWTPGEEVVLAANENYFNGVSPTKYIKYKVIAEDAAREIALENGEIDVMYAPPPEDIPRLETTEGLYVQIQQSLSSRVFQFGCNDPIISNPLVRQAISAAIDRTAITNALFPNGAATVNSGILPKGILGSKDQGVIQRDVEKAKELLVEAGYPDGFNTKIVVSPRYPKAVELGEALKDQLKDIGVIAEIEVLEWSVFLPMISGLTPEELDMPIFIMGVGTYMRDPDGALRRLFTTSTNGLNDAAYGFYSNAEVDDIVLSASRVTDLDTRLGMYDRALDILYTEDPAAVYLFDINFVIACSEKVSNVTIHPIGFVLFQNATVAK